MWLDFLFITFEKSIRSSVSDALSASGGAGLSNISENLNFFMRCSKDNGMKIFPYGGCTLQQSDFIPYLAYNPCRN
ncbi:MAG TPA: hypothetical protein ENN18_06970 [Proteobacteria bacterium]|nr:hypothetical protein [Pseudomonadota bacterium]